MVKVKFIDAFKNYVGLPDLREVMGQFNFNPVPSGLGSIPGTKIAGNAGFDFGIFSNRAGPKYGNFCGGGWTGGSNGKENPVDDLDVCCYHHDNCYKNDSLGVTNKACNEMFKSCLNKLDADPSKWRKPPANGEITPKLFKNGAKIIFTIKKN